eukprot:378812-Amphidinium_carterae.1
MGTAHDLLEVLATTRSASGMAPLQRSASPKRAQLREQTLSSERPYCTFVNARKRLVSGGIRMRSGSMSA